MQCKHPTSPRCLWWGACHKHREGQWCQRTELLSWETRIRSSYRRYSYDNKGSSVLQLSGTCW
jgi:hypothetical protein